MKRKIKNKKINKMSREEISVKIANLVKEDSKRMSLYMKHLMDRFFELVRV